MNAASPIPEGFWPCACHRTHRGKRQARFNGPEVERCDTCGATPTGEMPAQPLRKQIKVAVFAERRPRGWSYNAYTLWYSPTWPGICEHLVYAHNGTEAKKLAIAECRAQHEGRRK